MLKSKIKPIFAVILTLVMLLPAVPISYIIYAALPEETVTINFGSVLNPEVKRYGNGFIQAVFETANL